MNKRIALRFIQTGIQTTVQDFGRYGFQHEAIPIGGAMDRISMISANELVGNKEENPVLEMCLIGPRIAFEGACQIAMCGANLSALLNDQPVPMNETIQVQEGDILSFGKLLDGCRTYLAIGGTWNVKSWKGSASSAAQNPKEHTPNSQFSKGDILEIDPVFSEHQYIERSIKFIVPMRIRVVPGPEFDGFPHSFIRAFFSGTHFVALDSNRMGIRLDNECVLTDKKNDQMISSGVVPGTIQITETGKSIILMRDAQTVGGYHRFVNVIDSDLNLLAQAKPGDEIRFLLEEYS